MARWSYKKDQVPGLRILLANGANLNAKGDNGETRVALGAWSSGCVRILLAAGVHDNVANKQCMTTLMKSAWQGTDEPVNLLSDAGANPNAQEYATGWTPLNMPPFIKVLKR